MTSKVNIKANYREDRGGWIIYIPKSLVEDSSFPLDVKDKLVAKIEKSKVIIEKE
ncbi:MAG: hypothetical protein J4400_04545 [Candidatus Aenigmarchaeota archaeon]|nr:hypothetical protein [Candidatus Aenigmarchaeota archaeon]